MNPYTEPGWEKALKELEVLVGSSGIAWVAGLDLKGERSAVLAAAIYELHARLAERDKRIREYEESEASVCPEDVGFVEFIGVLQKRIAGLERALIGVTPSHRVKGKCWCPIAVDTGVTHSKACQAARAALAAQPPAQGITDTERMDEIENRKLHVQYRDGAPLSVEKWVARNDDGMWTASTARAAIDSARAQKWAGVKA